MFASPFIDETFDIYNCHNYTLSIRCAPDGFSFSVLDLTVNKFIVLSEFELNAASPFELKNELTSLIEKEPILKQTYKNVKISYTTAETTVVPEALYKAEEIDAIFRLSFEQNRNNELMATGTGSDFLQLSSIPKIIKDLMVKYFPNAKFYAPTSSLFHYNMKQRGHHDRLLVEINQHVMFLIFSKDGAPQLMNSFFVKNDTDCMYYILNTIKQLQGDSKTEIVLLGKVVPKAELETMLKRYFEKVSYARFNQNYAVSYTFYQEPEHFHIATTELALCE